MSIPFATNIQCYRAHHTSTCLPAELLELLVHALVVSPILPGLPHRFSEQLGEPIAATLLTNDRANLKLAKEANVSAMTIHSYVESVRGQYPDLAELLAPEASAAAEDINNSCGGKKPTRRQGGQRVLLFEEHKPMSELTAGIRQGR